MWDERSKMDDDGRKPKAGVVVGIPPRDFVVASPQPPGGVVPAPQQTDHVVVSGQPAANVVLQPQPRNSVIVERPADGESA